RWAGRLSRRGVRAAVQRGVMPTAPTNASKETDVMSVLERSELEASPLADLHAIADQLGLDGFRRLRKAELIDAILGEAGESSTPDDAAEEREEDEDGDAGRSAVRARRRAGRSARTRARTRRVGAARRGAQELQDAGAGAEPARPAAADRAAAVE